MGDTVPWTSCSLHHPRMLSRIIKHYCAPQGMGGLVKEHRRNTKTTLLFGCGWHLVFQGVWCMEMKQLKPAWFGSDGCPRLPKRSRQRFIGLIKRFMRLWWEAGSPGCLHWPDEKQLFSTSTWRVYGCGCLLRAQAEWGRGSPRDGPQKWRWRKNLALAGQNSEGHQYYQESRTNI